MMSSKVLVKTIKIKALPNKLDLEQYETQTSLLKFSPM